MSSTVRIIFRFAAVIIPTLAVLYITLLGCLTTPTFQSHVVYLHKIQITWSKDLDIPEQLGFLYNQVTPFWIKSSEGGCLYAWHILPIELYHRHETDLISESSGITSDFASRLAFKLLRDDPEARLVINFHGAAGTVGSGYRTHRALSAGSPGKIHVLTFGYRGFGKSDGVPSETGLNLDALSVIDWAIHTADIPPSRILIFGQSLGTAASLAVADHFAAQTPPVHFAGIILVVPFVDVGTLVATYRVGGLIPILSPIARFPSLFGYLRNFIRDSWLSKDRIVSYIKDVEKSNVPYRSTIIHAEDDCDVPCHHSLTLFWHAVNATLPGGLSKEGFEMRKDGLRTSLGSAGTVVEWRTGNGVLREEILKYGLHDVVMGNSVIAMAVMRIISGVDVTLRRGLK